MDLQRYNTPKRYAQFDGIEGVLWELVSRIPLTDVSGHRLSRRFMEIGSGPGDENNTRFLAEMGWKGEWIDPLVDPNLAPPGVECERRAITVEDIGHPHKFPPCVMSIDVDGNDYWLWKKLLECGWCPIVWIIECQLWNDPDYIMPYDPDYRFSHQLGDNTPGAGIGALRKLGEAHGYMYVGKLANPHDPNLFFVREEYRALVEPD